MLSVRRAGGNRPSVISLRIRVLFNLSTGQLAKSMTAQGSLWTVQLAASAAKQSSDPSRAVTTQVF